MCTSSVHIVFGVILGIGTLLTIIAFATNGWSDLYISPNATAGTTTADTVSFGLFGALCPDSESDQTMKQRCADAYKSLPTWKQAVIAFMILSVLGELLAIVWSAIVFASCCCKQCLAWPLPIVTGIVSLCLLLAIVIYACYMGEEPGDIPKSVGDLNAKSGIGYSLWIAIFAFVVMVADTICAIILVKVAAVAPI